MSTADADTNATSHASAPLTPDQASRLLARLSEPGAERLRATLARLVEPGAEVITMDTITTRDGQQIRRFILQHDGQSLREHAHWMQAFSKQHPEGYSAETRSLVINRCKMAHEAWRGQNESLQRAVFRSLDYQNMSYMWKFFAETVLHMPLDDLMRHVDVEPLLDRLQ